MFYRFPADPTAPGIAEGNFGNLSSARFFRMAERTLSFQGVVAARAMAEQNKKEGPAPTTARSSRPEGNGQVTVRTLHEMMLIDPSLVEYSKG